MDGMKYCQSCAMPLETPEVAGTNQDGTLNEDYCIYCFKEGSFAADVTMEEMISISLHHMKELFKDDPSFDEKEAEANMQSFFPELKRWKKEN